MLAEKMAHCKLEFGSHIWPFNDAEWPAEGMPADTTHLNPVW
jgi:hypothetical protein